MSETAESDDNPTFLRKRWVKNNLDVTGSQAAAIHDAFVTREQLLDRLRDGEDLTKYQGIGEQTSRALWDWFKDVHGETIDPDDTLVLDDDGLHLPDWLVGFVGTFTVNTPNITMRPTTTDRGLGEVSEILGAYPEEGTWNDRLSEGQIGLCAPGHSEHIYEIDDQRIEDGDQLVETKDGGHDD